MGVLLSTRGPASGAATVLASGVVSPPVPPVAPMPASGPLGISPPVPPVPVPPVPIPADPPVTGAPASAGPPLPPAPAGEPPPEHEAAREARDRISSSLPIGRRLGRIELAPPCWPDRPAPSK